MANVQLMPPPDGNHVATVVNGRKYTAAVASPITVPDFDASVLIAAGWVPTAPLGGLGMTSIGATTQRPPTPTIGQTHIDTTLGYMVTWMGPVFGWVHHATGATHQ